MLTIDYAIGQALTEVPLLSMRMASRRPISRARLCGSELDTMQYTPHTFFLVAELVLSLTFMLFMLNSSSAYTSNIPPQARTGRVTNKGTAVSGTEK